MTNQEITLLHNSLEFMMTRQNSNTPHADCS